MRAELALLLAKGSHLEGEIARGNITLAGVIDELEAATARAAELEERHRRRESRIAALEGELDSALTRVATLNESSASLELRVTDLLDTLAQRETQIRSLQSELDATKKRIEAAIENAAQVDRDRITKIEALAVQLTQSLQEVGGGIKRMLDLQGILQQLGRQGNPHEAEPRRAGILTRASNLLVSIRARARSGLYGVEAPPVDEQCRVIEGSNLFDAEWYVRRYPDVASAGVNPIVHYVTRGAHERKDPSPVFSTQFYLASNPEVRLANLNPFYHFVVIGRHQGRAPTRDAQHVQSLDQTAIVAAEFDDEFYRNKYGEKLSAQQALEHFMNRGWVEGRDPHPQFSTRFYLKENADVRRAGLNPYVHYLLAGRGEGRLPRQFQGLSEELIGQWSAIAREFDVQFYRTGNPDIVKNRIEPILHYLIQGWKQERDPHPQFSTAHYLENNRDVRTAGLNPYFHYLAEGRREGRQTKPAGSWPPRSEVHRVVEAEFDRDYYLARNLDVSKAGVDPIEHYLDFGWKEGRNPNADFSTRHYLDEYTDVSAAGINPFYHYLIAGRSEGRSFAHPGGWRAVALQRLRTMDDQIAHDAEHAPASGDLQASDKIAAAILEQGHRPGGSIFLTLSHDDYTTSVGGVQLCLKIEEERARARGMTHINLHPVLPIGVLSRDRLGGEVGLVVTCNGTRIGAASSRDLVRVLAALARDAKQTFLSVHSLVAHSTEAVARLHAAVQPARSFIWLHDYFTVCPSYTLLRNGISFCHGPRVDSSACGVCVFGDERREHARRMNDLFARIPFEVIAPSRFAADFWAAKSNLPSARLHVHEHCKVKAAKTIRSRPDGVVRVAFLGHPSAHKGWETFVELLREFEDDARYEFHHLGAGSRCDNRTIFTRVSVLDDGPNAMTDALLDRKIDVTLLWSNWPETFSFVAHESICAGAAVLTCEDSGNIARLVRERNCGRVLADEAALSAFFRSGEILSSVQAASRRLYRMEFSEMTVALIDQDEKR